MSFVPPPLKAPAPGTANQNNGVVNANAADAAVAEVAAGVEDAFITSRTFDLYWVDKSALMYKDGIIKVSFIWGFYKMLSLCLCRHQHHVMCTVLLHQAGTSYIDPFFTLLVVVD
jgi:hypothetical protein